ncbi:replication protein RepA [Corynebacterium crudilactis]|uniref:Plasmid encoded RepA protein n=1 Tax=Corynebacterium crudilactis TaxID=1652495 RepID=A0A172QY24_9CORY|nr:replication protein RepA [Corynebacterium crudilactis]ANE05546.1 hypothetical protein ccrud_14495 [Corynebacterium crudilactis]
MDKSIPNPDNSGTPEHILAIESRLAEIESGFFREYSYTSRTLIQATFPHSARSGNSVSLVNGDVCTKMFAPDFLPYGVYPRLIMCWITREAIIRRNLPLDEARVIPLGDSLAQFLREVGVKDASGGPTGSITGVRKQLIALTQTVISVEMTGTTDAEDMPRSFRTIRNTLLADDAHYWWDKQEPTEPFAELEITLSRRFYTDLVDAAVPLSNRIVAHVKRSPLCFDLYAWASYRINYLKHPTIVTWDQLRGQLGANYPDTVRGKLDFKKKIARALDRILEAWPEATISVTKYGLRLDPGEPSVPRKIGNRLLNKPTDDEAPF